MLKYFYFLIFYSKIFECWNGISKLTSFSKLISSSLIFNFFFGLSSISNNLLLTFKILLISCLRLTGAPSRFPGSTAENIMPRFGEWMDAAGRRHGRFIGVCPKIWILTRNRVFGGRFWTDWNDKNPWFYLDQRENQNHHWNQLFQGYPRDCGSLRGRSFYFLSMAVFTTGPSYESKLMNNYLAEAESVSLLSGNSNIRNRN